MFNNSNRVFMAPHLVRAWSVYKDIRICSTHTLARTHVCMHTNTYTVMHTLVCTHICAHTRTHTHIHTLFNESVETNRFQRLHSARRKLHKCSDR